MKKDSRVLSSSLSELIKKFSKNDVIAVMEKEYQSAPAKLIPLELIDDTSFIKSAKMREEVIASLAAGLKEKGFFTPIAVRPVNGRYEVVLGRKRLHAAKKAGLVSVPAVVKEFSDEETLLMLLADARDQRENDVVEMALICQRLSHEFGYTQQMLANVSHQSRCQITNILRILRLPQPILDEISVGKLSYGHAKAIASTSLDSVEALVKRIHEESLSVRETEALVRAFQNGFHDEEERSRILKNAKAKDLLVNKKSLTFSFENEQEKEAFLHRLAALQDE